MKMQNSTRAIRKRRMKHSTYAYILIAPGLILIAVILVYPLVRGILSSFFVQAPGSIEFENFVGLEHYRAVLNDPIFIKAFTNTIIWTVTIVVIQYFVGLGSALLLNKSYRGRGLYRSLILIPWVVPGIAAAMTWKWMYSCQYGIINQALTALGLISSNVDWLGSTETALGAVIVTAIWKAIPFITIVLLAALQGIDTTLYEAVRIDGGSSLQVFRHIMVPGIKKVSITTLLLQTIWTFNQFDIVYSMTKGGPSNATQIIPVFTYVTAFNFFNLNKAAAIGVIGLLVVGVVAVFYIVFANKED